ncbi:MAG: LysM peptidoglycan-binding domain-containing protein [Chitinophagaceae bacterium]|nr:LysM peptidoglycan-binding domain-containing protein [Chitinophagaceae bacterium]
MSKFSFSYLLLVFCVQSLSAQKADLIVKTGDKGLYLEHKVARGESFFAVGRLYNVSAKYLAIFNKLDLNKGLLIDQKINIPLTDTNFTQQGNTGTPVYYTAIQSPTLETISSKVKNVSVENIRMWNDISVTEVIPGTKLIIGFLQSKEMASVTINNKPKQEEPVAKVVEKPVVKAEEKPVVKEEVKPIEQKAEEKPVVKLIEEKIEEKVVITEQGYFKNHFEQQIRTNPASKNETVASGIFKTASGWKDSKYYLLIDKVPAGTIVKVINPTNNKAVYAKVLGEMSGIRQNEGLSIRISNAAATTLNITEQDKFIVTVNY